MSQIKATITGISTLESLNIVTFNFHGTQLKMMSLDLMPSVQRGKVAILAVKPTHIGIAKDVSGMLSYSNQIRVTIDTIDKGVLLSSLKLLAGDLLLESIITTQTVSMMALEVGDEVAALIKASDISLMEVLHD